MRLHDLEVFRLSRENCIAFLDRHELRRFQEALALTTLPSPLSWSAAVEMVITAQGQAIVTDDKIEAALDVLRESGAPYRTPRYRHNAATGELHEHKGDHYLFVRHCSEEVFEQEYEKVFLD